MVEELADGAVVVELPYGSPDWLVREILKGVGDLVVLEPTEAREAVLDAVGERVAGPPIDSPPGHPEIVRIVAPNPGPMTLEGTNTYVVGDDPAYVVDPGPADERHLEAVRSAAAERGGIAGVLLTHSHADHSAAAPMLEAPLLFGDVGAADEASGEAETPAAQSRSPASPSASAPSRSCRPPATRPITSAS